MARTLIATGDPIVAAGNPSLPDIKNRYGREIWASFLAEHNEDGTHKSPYNLFAGGYANTYQGDGTSSQAIDVSGDGISGVGAVFIWCEDDGHLYVTTTSLEVTKTLDAIADLTDDITIDTTGFTVSGALNTTSTDYAYLLFTQGSVQGSGDVTNPPTYVQHGDALPRDAHGRFALDAAL